MWELINQLVIFFWEFLNADTITIEIVLNNIFFYNDEIVITIEIEFNKARKY